MSERGRERECRREGESVSVGERVSGRECRREGEWERVCVNE